ncbi:DNA mismatch repair protein MutS [Lactobacillus delbrueckii subsp. lactis]|jgi:DNA mismatch repair protein MutS|uniref:DNA mismatch repair protein MutS n=2 Tax=Lactobacillus delbrueckii TaxID=1584 RepID=A0ABD4W1Q3_9LACO|nr:DNA mismatch repair protein MutS [Lactobacillus delbrueckii]ADQ61551.1 DNA mismatch repair protein mutS [Lactobacillus delbrueckii subsp. bulgaricus ND02]APG68879.1 DNA mismatch repair protein MutS [Lactobacillus delbrueckii subsp. lactis]ASW12415.1 DNA mismatch repair protein MutS [Lactobacillus delbrueckii subsp. lactis DSM 20072]ASW64305.1 DNA mismatch repair protein MutS [Lactobacillus delbrueckii subsp. lactis]EGD27762.1 DNA mismatch repair protein HexA [Lactobacillus delbrueckii subsp
MPRKATTPMMEQYYQIKDQYPDAFLFYRVGDFYELYEDDAIKGSQILELTLTHRSNKSENPIPMAGVPHMAVDSYVNTLVEKGYKVAICEQLEDPKKAKGMVKRGIIQLVTPGTKMAQGPDDSQESNYLTSVVEKAGGYGLAYSDLSTGEIFATHVKRYAEVVNELLSLRTREVVFAGNLSASDRDRLQKANITVSEPAELEGEYAEISYVQQKLTDSMEKAAVRQLVVYLLATQKRSLAHLQVAESFEIGQYLQMANTVQRNLELTQSATTGRKQGSLFWVLDKTTTAMGGRLLKQWLSRPLLSLDRIKQRQQMVQALLDDYFTRENIVDSLKGVYDLERLSGRVAFGNVNPRELLQLAKSLEATKPIIQALAESGNPDLEKYGQGIDPQSELAESITNCLVDQPPISAKDGGIIRAGVSEDLDKYREAMNGGKKWLAQMEMEERQRTGIDNLKIGYNRVFGYFIQVSKGNVAKVPQDRYTRKQTLTNAERYITPELKEHENLILEAESRSTDLEYELFSQLREAVKAHIPALQELGRQLAALDVFVAFAQDAEEKNYCRPSFSSKNEIAVKNGRHPVVEAVLPAGSYIPNDLVMDEDTSIYLITGPNMSGKSTYMRQLALIAIMAQIGSFVPADSAKLPVFDQVFTRIGAADDLYSGKSTFMVEMSEANEALQHASSRSLVLFDEIGRGTATYDGMALAGAIIKYLHDKVGAKTLFATHYHELTELDETLPHLKNIHVGATEENGQLIFLHKILPGPADQSYGIHVAKLAGLPRAVLREASSMLKRLEAEGAREINPSRQQLDLFSPVEVVEENPLKAEQEELLDEISQVNLNEKTPLEVMQLVADWQQALKEE